MAAWRRHDDAVHLRIGESVQNNRGAQRLRALYGRRQFSRRELENRDTTVATDLFAEVVEQEAESYFAQDKLMPPDGIHHVARYRSSTTGSKWPVCDIRAGQVRCYRIAGLFPLKKLSIGKSVAQNLTTTQPFSLSHGSASLASTTVAEMRKPNF